jgi:hypothetical protein
LGFEETANARRRCSANTRRRGGGARAARMERGRRAKTHPDEAAERRLRQILKIFSPARGEKIS